MRLESLELRGVGPFEELRLEFPKGTDDGLADAYILVGPNGCGKSSILAAIAAGFGDDEAVRRRMWASGSSFSVGWGEGLRTGFERLSELQWTGSGDGIRQRSAAGPPYRFWAFAYSGSHEIQNLRSGPVMQAPSSDPTSYSATFERPGNEALLAAWLVENDYANASAVRDQRLNDIARTAEARDFVTALIKEFTGAVSASLSVKSRFTGPNTAYNVELELGGKSLPLDSWAAGIRSTMGWILDLTLRLDRMPWEGDIPLRQREFLLLLDEIDVHLHPGWQRRVLPMVQRAFPKAQIVLSTHSPFVVGSADDARVYPFSLDPQSGKARLMQRSELEMDEDPEPIERGLRPFTGVSYDVILDHVFGVKSRFDAETELQLRSFKELRDRVLRRQGTLDDLKIRAGELSGRGEELQEIVWTEYKQTKDRVG